MKTSKIPDRRFTVSVAADLAQKVDDFVAEHDRITRSAVIEQALRLWESLAEYPNRDEVFVEAIRLYQQQQERELYREYYGALSDAAVAEDNTWTDISHRSAGKNWPPRKGKTTRK